MDDLRQGLENLIAILRAAPREEVRVVRMDDDDLQRAASSLQLLAVHLEDAAARRITGPCVTCIHRQRAEAAVARAQKAGAVDEDVA